MAENELNLINKVELRIALAESDELFQNAINTYLAPLLLKLGSPHAEVRNSILKIIQYLVSRINTRSNIKLPVHALLDQAKSRKGSGSDGLQLVQLYSLVFAAKGIPRLTEDESVSLIPQVITDISRQTREVSARLFSILSLLLVFWKEPSRNVEAHMEVRKFLGFSDNSSDELAICDWASKLFLLQQSVMSPTEPIPGLNVKDIEFLTKVAGISYNSLKELQDVKSRVLKFLMSGFKEDNIAIPLVIASSDSSSVISDNASFSLSKLQFNVERKEFVDGLIKLFVGSPESQTPPVSAILQEKIMSVLTTSHVATRNPLIFEMAEMGLKSDFFKLKRSTSQFIKWVNQSRSYREDESNDLLESFNGLMLSLIKDDITSLGWPQLDTLKVKNYMVGISHRQLQYEALGFILRYSPELFIHDFENLNFLFLSLIDENPDLKPYVQDGLTGLLMHSSKFLTNLKSRLKDLAKDLLGNFEKEKSLQQARFVMIKYLISCYPFHDAQARYLCVLGTFKENSYDTIEESKKGLHPYWFNMLQSSTNSAFDHSIFFDGDISSAQFPNFSDMYWTIERELRNASSTHTVVHYCLNSGISFLLYTLVMQAIPEKNSVIVKDRDWELRLEKALEVDSVTLSALASQIKLLVNDYVEGQQNSFISFLLLIFDCFASQFTVNSGLPNDGIYGMVFSKLISSSPSEVVAGLSVAVPRLLELSRNKLLNDDISQQVAKSLGLIVTHPKNDDHFVHDVLYECASSLDSTLLICKILSVAYILSRLKVRLRVNIVNENFVISYLKVLLDTLSNYRTYKVVLECVSQLFIFDVLSIKSDELEERKQYINHFVGVIIENVKKYDERSIIAMSHIAFPNAIEDDSEELNKYEKLIFDTHNSRRIEGHFVSGEAFCIFGAGWNTQLVYNLFDIQEENPNMSMDSTPRLKVILGHICKACTASKPSLRKAACIWLLSLVQYCGHLDAVKNKAEHIHQLFMQYLADNDEIVQESASRGLSLVYDIGDVSTKEALVKSLFKSFTEGNSSTGIRGTVEEDTELFEPDYLRTNEGSITTYRDVLRLASDIGDPSLVYKFMSLAKSSALWSSRKGMAFGLGSILSKSALDDTILSNRDLCEKLIPKLFRYRYDPFGSVSNSMTTIWNAMFKDTLKIISNHFDVILKELLLGMGNKEWRVRQASAAALDDLTSKATTRKLEDEMEEIWNMSFRAMDDIKESVRQQGSRLTRNLVTTLIKIMNGEREASTSSANRILLNILPVLLGPKGIHSNVDEVRSFAVEALVKICDIKKERIRPFVPELIENLILLMSSVEPEVLNYLVLNADKYNLRSEDIDAQRLRNVGHSPLMNALERLLDSVDGEMMPELIDRLCASIKKAVGLPSKICGSKVLVNLLAKNTILLQPYCDKLLALAWSQIHDKNPSVASSYAMAAGHICRVSSPKIVTDYAKYLAKNFFEADDGQIREIAAIAIDSISKHASDKFELCLSIFFPLAFVGRFDSNEIVKNALENVWVENASASSSIQLYSTEIFSLCKTYMNSPLFEVRKTIGKSIIDLCKSTKDINLLPESLSSSLIDVLMSSGKGKSWSGKEILFESLVLVSIKSKNFVQVSGKVNEINDVVLAEMRRKNTAYRKHSVKIAGNYLHHFPSEEITRTYVEAIRKFLIIYSSDDDMDEKIPAATSFQLEESKISFLKNFFESLPLTLDPWFIDQLLQCVYDYLTHETELTWRSMTSICENLKNLISKLQSATTSESLDKEYECWHLLKLHCLRIDSIENVKIQFIRFSIQLHKYFIERGHDKSSLIKQTLEGLSSSESSTIVRAELANAH